MLDNFCSSEFWDWDLSWNTETPVFTTCFLKTALIWGPVAFFWIFAPMETYFIARNKEKEIPWSPLNIMKLIAVVSLVAISAGDLSLQVVLYTKTDVRPVEYYTPFILFVTLLAASILMGWMRRKGAATSGTLFLFWFLLSIGTGTSYYVAMQKTFNEAFNYDKDYEFYQFTTIVLYFGLSLAEFFLHCFSDRTEHPKNIPERENPEERASFLSRLTFSWFSPMVMRGYKKPLISSDVWTLGKSNRTETLQERFRKNWIAHLDNLKSRRRKQSRAGVSDCSTQTENDLSELSIVGPIMKTFGLELFTAGFLKVFGDAINFINPILLDQLITFVGSDEPYWKGLSYAFGMLLVSAVESIFNSQHEYRISIVAMRIRSCIISIVYEKAMTLSPAARRNYTVGEVVNLMAVDTQRVMEYIQRVFILFSAPLQLSIASYLLWQQLGIATLGGLAIFFLMIPYNTFVTFRMKKYQNRLMKDKDGRTKLMNEILNGIKVLKLYVWENSFIKKVMKIRSKEICSLRSQAYLNAAITFSLLSVPYLVSLASFATFILISPQNVLDANKAFVSLTLFNLIRQPMARLPMVFTFTVMFVVSLKRINKYLRSEEIDPNLIQHDETEEDPVVVENGSFSWSAAEEPTLTDVSLRVKKGSLVAIVGQVGAGKSSIISALLGEMLKCSGRVNVTGSVAYVPQQAWIQNMTLRQNILFTKPYNVVPYKEILEACALMPDLEMLPGGDETEIGEKGINLSGGQKQRVSLARAIYNDADVYYFDDPLSAVDVHVGKHIFKKVIGPQGMLREKTRILVTHRISVLPEVDTIIVLQEGRISEMGSYQELLAKKGAFADFLVQYLEERIIQRKDILLPDELSLMEEITATVGARSEITRELSRRSEGGSESDTGNITQLKRADSKPEGEDGVRKRRTSDVETVSKHSDLIRRISSVRKTEEKRTRLIEKEGMELGSVKSSVYFNFLRYYGTWNFVFTVACYIIQMSFSLSYGIWLSVWSNDSLDPEKAQDTNLRNLRLGVYGALGAGETCFVLTASILMNLCCVRASRILHDKMLLHIMRAPMSFFETTPLGRVLNRFSKDIDTIDVTIRFNLRVLLNSLARTIPAIIAVSLESPFFLLACLPLAVIYGLLQKFYIPTSRQLKRLESTTRSPIYSHFSETVTGCQIIRAYRAQKTFANCSNDLVDFNNESYYSTLAANRWLTLRLEFLGYVVALFASLLAVFTRDSLSPGLAGLSVSYALQVTNILNTIVRAMTDVETNFVAVERCLEYTTKTPTEAEWSNEQTLPEEHWPDEGKIDFREYSTRYREGLELVLDGISCSIDPKQRCAIVGRTGAGKSSLALALFRIIEAARGKILIDRVEIAKLGLHDLRSKLTIIPQDPFLFTGSLRINLDPFQTHSDDALWTALELAHLKDFVQSLEKGLQHEISESGENLSGGQRQLLCLARALLRKSKILVLDEATAAVDVETDELIQSTIRSEFGDCTVITIAHRLDTILDYDKVIVLDRGEIKEMGKPEDLLKDENSSFYAMAVDAGLA